MSKPMSLIIAWTYVCPSYVVSLDIRMSNLDKRMSNLTMLFNLTVSNFLTSGSFKNLTKHPESYIQSWIFGSFVLSKFQYQLGHTYVQAGHTFVQVGHTYVQVGHTYVQNNNASTELMLHWNHSILSTGLGSLLLLLGCNHHVPLFTPQVTHCSMNNFFITDLCFFCIKVFYYIFACFFLKCISESFFWSLIKVQILYLFFFSANIFQYFWI